jgi:hypothetical protein
MVSLVTTPSVLRSPRMCCAGAMQVLRYIYACFYFSIQARTCSLEGLVDLHFILVSTRALWEDLEL